MVISLVPTNALELYPVMCICLYRNLTRNGCVLHSMNFTIIHLTMTLRLPSAPSPGVNPAYRCATKLYKTVRIMHLQDTSVTMMLMGSVVINVKSFMVDYQLSCVQTKVSICMKNTIVYIRNVLFIA